MNRLQRNYGRTPKRNDGEAHSPTRLAQPVRIRAEARNTNNVMEIKEVLPPRMIKEPPKGIPMTNRSCYVKPIQRSVALLAELSDSPSQYEDLIPERLSFLFDGTESNSPINKKLHDLRKEYLLSTMVDNDCQYSSDSAFYADSVDGEQWQNVDNADDIDQYIMKGRDEETLTRYHNLPKNFQISNAPRIKTIAEKFSKFKKNNIELRKLEEKVICVEYDVFDKDHDLETPVQRMRAFFSLKPVCDENEENILTDLPSIIKDKFNIPPEVEQKLSQTEMEIIDGKLTENRPYLNDLEKVLLRRQNSAKKKTSTFDLQTLHDMANREYLESDDGVLSSNEAIKIFDIHKLILSKSSVHGITRRTVKPHKEASDMSCKSKEDTISGRLVTELLKTDGTV